MDNAADNTSHESLIGEPELDVNTGSPIMHRLIIGDNLPIMRIIGPEYNGRVDVIYIDPPYNTRSNYIYDDHFNGGGERTWVDFMRPRLELAKRLLSDQGLIFISIDENERYELKPLMDSIFGKSRFIADIVWKKKKSSGSNYRGATISTLTESILVYGGSNRVIMRGREYDKSAYKLRDGHYDEWGGYNTRRLDGSSLRYSPTLDYPLTIDGTTYYAGNPSNGRLPGREDMERRITEHRERDWCWTWSKDHVEWGLRNGVVIVEHGIVKRKIYDKADYWGRPLRRSYNYTNLILDNAMTSDKGNTDIIAVFGRRVFSYPKPVALIKYLISMCPNDDALVMDFFAGSGTTGQAVAEMNAEDGGHRRCVLITDDDSNGRNRIDIGRAVTAERMRRVLTGQDWHDGKRHRNLEQGLQVQSLKTDGGGNPDCGDE